MVVPKVNQCHKKIYKSRISETREILDKYETVSFIIYELMNHIQNIYID